MSGVLRTVRFETGQAFRLGVDAMAFVAALVCFGAIADAFWDDDFCFFFFRSGFEWFTHGLRRRLD